MREHSLEGAIGERHFRIRKSEIYTQKLNISKKNAYKYEANY